ncbi:hypothetical protein JY651_35720 [Pyxidicoccus parkwayensis]|uniref:Uncharacterized protein n=1 Tax=Pyxidicoccus parkwayensis TaxID=2813578 RepID=A0ABX7NT25_9BACT|nr:hypothetical protein [Pyxidicoccus parkwaysis]QSQ20551.1 hypothetical protein JY651_35720 [Pyxidicoccus parkwaysis]
MTDSTGALEHEALLAAIGRALGSDAPYGEVEGAPGNALHLGTMKLLPAGTSLEVLGGAVDAHGRVAWVEQRTDAPEGGYVPVSIDVRFAWDGQPRGQVEVPTYNPFFGCRVGFMRWYGDALLVIYREKHKTLALRLHPPAEALTLATLEDSWVFDDDAVYFRSPHHGLLEGRLLPSLEQALPLPAPTSVSSMQFFLHAPGMLGLAPRPRLENGDTRDTYQLRLKKARELAWHIPLPPREARAFTPRPEALWARMHVLLASTVPPAFGVDVLTGAVARSFWREELPLATSYASRSGRGSSPEYLPVYWYQHLRADNRAEEADAWLHWLERVADMRDVDLTPWLRGHDADETVARAALVFLKVRARVLANACRTGRLPEGEWCYLFTTRERTQRLEQDAAQPEGFREVLRQVVEGRPKSLSEGT